MEELESLAKSLGAKDWDIMLVGDGAGSLVTTPCGWHVVLYERKTGRSWEHFGGANGGTNNYAELEPFVFALWAYRHVLWAYHTGKLANQSPTVAKKPRVLIVSDSLVTVECGNQNFARNANAPLWASIEWFERKGYQFQWIHVPRNSNPFNERADRMAKSVRKSLTNLSGEELSC